LNDFVASAVTKGEIEILSDGSPWRPLVHVKDMALSIEWAINRSVGDLFLSINIGSEEWGYQIRDLAYVVKDIIPDTVININHDAQPDTRSYQVDFSLFEQLAPNHQPQVTIEEAVIGLSEGLSEINFMDLDFRKSKTLIRLNTLRDHCQSGRLDNDLYWVQ
jgi:nucleoside-diphosphate-sugar epimerase